VAIFQKKLPTFPFCFTFQGMIHGLPAAEELEALKTTVQQFFGNVV